MRELNKQGKIFCGTGAGLWFIGFILIKFISAWLLWGIGLVLVSAGLGIMGLLLLAISSLYFLGRRMIK